MEENEFLASEVAKLVKENKCLKKLLQSQGRSAQDEEDILGEKQLDGKRTRETQAANEQGPGSDGTRKERKSENYEECRKLKEKTRKVHKEIDKLKIEVAKESQKPK